MDLDTIDGFRQAVDLLAKINKLDPAMPELDRLKLPEVARQILDEGNAYEVLRLLCPETNAYYDHTDCWEDTTKLTIVTRSEFGFILPPLLLLRRFVYDFGSNAKTLWTRGEDVHIGGYGGYPLEAIIEGLNIGPDAPEEHYRLITDIINAITVQELDYRQFVGATEITLSCQQDRYGRSGIEESWELTSTRKVDGADVSTKQSFSAPLERHPQTT